MHEITPQQLKDRLSAPRRPCSSTWRQDWETKRCRLPTRCTSHRGVRAARRGAESDDEIVVYCHQGVVDAAVANYLRASVP